MDLRQLRYFIAVSEHESISAAAEAVHIVQPALTRQMQALELEIGTKLLERTTRGAHLTDAGRQLLVDAYRLIDDESAAKERALRAGQGALGTISLALPVMQKPVIEEILKAYRKETPEVAMTVHQLVSEAQLTMLINGQLDAGFMLLRPKGERMLAAVPVFSDPMLLAYPSEWTWPRGKPQRLKDLNQLDFIWLQRSAAPAWHDSMISSFYAAGFVPRPIVYGVSAASMMTLVAAGMGCTCLPASAQAIAPKSVSFMPLSDLRIDQHWELVWRSDRVSATLRRLIDIVVRRFQGNKAVPRGTAAPAKGRARKRSTPSAGRSGRP